jgi:hypothetical protein
MINHLRTLLINEVGSDSEDFEEIVSPDFSPIPLLSAEGSVQRHLVPPHFPRRTRNYIATVLVGIAEEHQHYDKILGLDPRSLILADIGATPLFTKLTAQGSGAFSKIQFRGEFHARPDVGIFSTKWRIFEDGGFATIVNLDTHARSVASFTYSPGSDVSGFTLIPDSGIEMRVVGSATLPVFDIELTASAPISFNISTVLSYMRADEMTFAVFNLKDKALGNSLLQDFRFSDHPSIAIGAVLIAYAMHISERTFE